MNERKDPFGAISMPFIRMRRMRIRDWGRVRDMIIPAAATPPETKCRRRLLCWNRETEGDWHFLREWQAITAMMEIFSPGDHLIATDDLYGGTLRLWNMISHKNGISVDCVDTSNVDTVKAALRRRQKLSIWRHRPIR